MDFSSIIIKLKRRIWGIVVSKTRSKNYYPQIYRSYWHFKFHFQQKNIAEINYYSAVPNRGAGIGHQLANWIAGYWHARQFGLKFAHIPFSTDKWERFLGFGEDEITAEELIKKRGYKKVLLPLFNEFAPEEVALIKRIINSYNDQRVVFVAEQDQSYQEQYGVMTDLKRKFYAAKARKKDRLIYSKDTFNIAIHVRRGDIVIGQENNNPNLQFRWQDNSYFEKVLSTVVGQIKTDKPIAIYLFSQGERKDFPEFERFDNIHFCLDMGAQDSFLYMVFADLLITSKSSFSYKPALLSNGIKVCPKDFWHRYPETEDWILVENDGTFDVNSL